MSRDPKYSKLRAKFCGEFVNYVLVGTVVITASASKLPNVVKIHADTCPKPPEDQHSRRGARRTREMVTA